MDFLWKALESIELRDGKYGINIFLKFNIQHKFAGEHF